MATTTTSETATNESTGGAGVDYDALVIGAGFGGIRMLYELGKRGLSAKAFEAGTGVGGTWYWNRYPGARTDSESWVYIITFLEELGLDWDWKERFPTQPEVEVYLNRVTDHLGLRKKIEFQTKGDTYTCTFLITATGPLATPLKPPFPGLESYKGEWYQTGLWPKHKVDFTGKRVAVVGTGATAVQVIPIVAHNAKTLTVFQRTPNYVLPARNYPLTEDQQLALRREYEKVVKRARAQTFGMDFVDATLKSTDLETEADMLKVLEFGWEIGGFRFIFETFADMLTNPKCNEMAAEFVRNKIRSIVKDKKTAELLCPHYTILSKRPPLGHFYYEAFNRDNVELVDVKDDPIREITPTGLRTGTREFEFDMIIFAVGFDAITGTLAQIDLRGSQHQVLAEQLNKDMATAYGITAPGFPNLFMVSGPQAPFANIPIIIDNTVDWIGKTVAFMRTNGYGRIDTKEDHARSWSDQVDAAFNATVLAEGAKETRSWYIGANTEGKTVRPLFWFGGVGPYFERCDKEISDGYPGFEFSSPEQAGRARL
ncbi:hypothetical protein AYL99_08569 [Fonsecaea erecta]|uniref:FAD/NAD(P)-binding domain-containing protein n=1 Tax=Fonsecaea erecta TaxID=1367422 RepID=A0A178ZED2_9EURO|nr:hypothetical protein AYL99_08569 [Fonsecaea erecta]OAP57831.1 hypothetical protein AYL99_08569 [Fonsecaea erecta]